MIKLDYIFLAILIFLTSYDLLKSNLINKKHIFINIFSSLSLITIILYNQIQLQYYVYIIFFSIFIFFFLTSKFKTISLILLLNLVFLLSFYLIDENRNLFFLIIVMSFINDTIAFLIGSIFKGPLIIPSISPKKTWSGTLSSFLVSFFLLFLFNFNLFFSIAISLSFFFGDIFFSYFKRIKKIKDFSNLFQDHGGFLDRFDSIFFPILFLSIYVN